MWKEKRRWKLILKFWQRTENCIKKDQNKNEKDNTQNADCIYENKIRMYAKAFSAI